MNLGTARRSENWFTDGSVIAIDVVTMLTHTFSSFLDSQKAWFVLNDKLCDIPPRRFCANGMFNLFRDREEICHVNIVSTEEPKVRMTFMLASLSLFCQEICAEKIKVRENF